MCAQSKRHSWCYTLSRANQRKNQAQVEAELKQFKIVIEKH